MTSSDNDNNSFDDTWSDDALNEDDSEDEQKEYERSKQEISSDHMTSTVWSWLSNSFAALEQAFNNMTSNELDLGHSSH